MSAAVFVSQTIEFLPSGLVPGIAADFHRSIAETAQLVTVFALAVIVSTTPLALALRRVPRKPVLLIALAAILVGTVLVASAPTFELLLAARAFTGIAHGLFWSVVFAYPPLLVQPHRLARAMVVTSAGASLSGILGIPVGNALGQAFGWRTAFLCVAAAGAVAWAVIAAVLPPAASAPVHREGSRSSPARDPSFRAVIGICSLILLVVVSYTSFGTFLVPWLTENAGLPPSVVPGVLLLSGGIGATGVVLVGAVHHRAPVTIFAIALIVLIGGLLLAPWAAAQPPGWVLALVLTNTLAFAGVPLTLQVWMMGAASQRLQTFASALQTTAFNIGIGGGALVGGLVITGASLAFLPVAAACGLGAALLFFLAWVLIRVWRRGRGQRLPAPSVGNLLLAGEEEERRHAR